MGAKMKLGLEEITQALELRKQGMKYREISSILGVSCRTVRRRFHPEWQERRKAYVVLNVIHTKVNGKPTVLRAKKRTRPDDCELCRTSSFGRRLSWHRWDHGHPEQGLWLCPGCHMFAEGVVRGLKVEVYLALREATKGVGEL